MSGATRKDEPLVIAELENNVGFATELTPQEKARLTLARWILGAVLLLFLCAATALLFSPDNRVDQAKEFFEFVKSFGPPIVTLVIGFYFRGETSS